jgi:hypothetical protein
MGANGDRAKSGPLARGKYRLTAIGFERKAPAQNSDYDLACGEASRAEYFSSK